MQILKAKNGSEIHAWIDNISIESKAIDQLKETASLDKLFGHISVMPDAHVGMGCTIGTVLATKDIVVPSCVGVDIGCGMISVKTNLRKENIVDKKQLREKIEKEIPVGRTNSGGNGDRGAWHNIPNHILNIWRSELDEGLNEIKEKNPDIVTKRTNTSNHLGTLGSGNHFIEICLDNKNLVWIVIHSGSRGIGNRIGQYFIKKAKEYCQDNKISTPNRDLCYLGRDTDLFDNYVEAQCWSLKFAKLNREIILYNVKRVIEEEFGDTIFGNQIHCHHNYMSKETHFGEDLFITRKGAISAFNGEYGIIPGSMGAKTYIVKGLGNKDSYCSASHGAGRAMSRTAAKKQFTVDEHIEATSGVECRKDIGIIDETPMAYKDIDDVIEAEKDLVLPVNELKQIICIKG